MHAPKQTAEKPTAPHVNKGTAARAVPSSHAAPAWERALSTKPLVDLKMPIQTKLTVNQPGDEFEQEADQVAATVMRMPAPPLQHNAAPVIPSIIPIARIAQPTLQRAPTPATPTAPVAPGAMSRATFKRAMFSRYLVAEIKVGTFDEQLNRLPRPGGNPPAGFSRATWQEFDPGESSEVYTWILEAFEEFERSIGGIPPVNRILFFHMHYDVSAGVATPNPDVGASFGAGEMVVYHKSITSRKGLPFARSNAAGNYPGGPVVSISGTGSSPGAPIPLPTRAESTGAVIIHELGHGLAEAAHRADPNVFTDYNAAVGWFGTPQRLYDIGVRAVQRAIQQGTQPPANLEITEAHWNDPKWVEQPVSGYMVAGGPGEDFAEAVLTYVRNRDLLRSRSPVRYEFIHSRIQQWLPQLVQRPPVGDFPMPREHYA